MPLRRCVLGLLLCTVACDQDSMPVVPVFDPLEGVTELVLEVPAEMVRVGALVDVRVLNGSAKSVSAVLPCRLFDVERQDADAWVVLPTEVFGCTGMPASIAAGRVYEETVRVPDEGEPGVYRISFPHWVEPEGRVVTVSNTFRVEPSGVADQAP